MVAVRKKIARSAGELILVPHFQNDRTTVEYVITLVLLQIGLYSFRVEKGWKER